MIKDRLNRQIVPLAEIEKQSILNALNIHNGNRTYAADALGISVRTMRNKIRRYRKLGEVIPGNDDNNNEDPSLDPKSPSLVIPL